MIKTKAKSPKSDLERAQDRLVRYLALRDHSQQELKVKLERNFPPEIVDQAMSAAAARGLLIPESQVAERLVEELVRKHKSHRFIEEQLLKRGLPVPAFTMDDEILRARHLVERKFGLDSLSYEDKAKAYSFLKNRGFEDRAIEQVLNEER